MADLDSIMALLGDAGEEGGAPPPPEQDHGDIDDLMGAFDWDDAGAAPAESVKAGAGAKAPPKVPKKKTAKAPKTKIPVDMRFNGKDSEDVKSKKVAKLKKEIAKKEKSKEALARVQDGYDGDSLEKNKVDKEMEEVSQAIADYEAEIALMEEPELDFDGLDDALDGLMDNITDGVDTTEMGDVFSGKRCGKCNKVVATHEEVKMFGRSFHVKCSAECQKCGEKIDPHDKSGQEEAQVKIDEFKEKIAKAEKEKQGLSMMTALYKEGTPEYKNVQSQVNDCDNKLRRFTKQMNAVEVKSVTFVEYGQQVWHSECLKCAVSSCGKKLETAKWVKYDEEGVMNIVCKYCCFSNQNLICTTCDKPVDVEMGHQPVRAKGNTFHKNCFVCFHCKKKLKAFRENNGKVYCTPCHTKLH